MANCGTCSKSRSTNQTPTPIKPSVAGYMPMPKAWRSRKTQPPVTLLLLEEIRLRNVSSPASARAIPRISSLRSNDSPWRMGRGALLLLGRRKKRWMRGSSGLKDGLALRVDDFGALEERAPAGGGPVRAADVLLAAPDLPEVGFAPGFGFLALLLLEGELLLAGIVLRIIAQMVVFQDADRPHFCATIAAHINPKYRWFLCSRYCF